MCPPGVEKIHIRKKKKKLNDEVFKIFIQIQAAVLNLGATGALKLRVKV